MLLGTVNEKNNIIVFYSFDEMNRIAVIAKAEAV